VLEERKIMLQMVDNKMTKNESVRSKISNRSVMSQKSNGFRLIDNNIGKIEMGHLTRYLCKQRIKLMMHSYLLRDTNA